MLGPLMSTAQHHVVPWVRRGGVNLPPQEWYSSGSIDIALLERVCVDNPLWGELKAGLLAVCAMDGWRTCMPKVDAGDVVEVPAEEVSPKAKRSAPVRRRKPKGKKAHQEK